MEVRVAVANFADRLIEAVTTKRTPLCVGLDPVFESLPDAIRGQASLGGDGDLEGQVDGILEFCTRILKVVAPHVGVVKINSAFFEQYYQYGIEAFWAVVQEADAHGLIVNNDCNRADIGNTSERYARATLGEPPFESMDDLSGPDAVTVAPYMGADSVGPFIKLAETEGKGLFVLVRTSNPGAAEIQDALLADGTPVYQQVGKLVAKWGEHLMGDRGYSAVGAVVGATNPDQLAALRQLMPKTVFLVPGYGAQGGSAKDVAKAFRSDGTGAIINSSRGIIFAHKDPKHADLAASNWEKAVEAAVLSAKKELAEALG
jgi:orotidine-5'-phosphate decarboxylase